MMLFTFFTTVFSSACWLIYSVMFVYSKLATQGLGEQTPQDMLLFLAVVFLPIGVIWMVFNFINQFSINRSMNVKQSELLRQLQKNQDYTDLVVRVMLDAEHEIKDGFVINKFDMFIGDMNESLSEIIQRCNIASSAQLEQLWQRVKRGEKWALGKAVLDASKSQSTFDAWVREKVNRDKVFRGTLLEFCSRYQNLLQLLEKHDRDRIFLQIIETGVYGKVYSIIAPLSEEISAPSISLKDTPAAVKNDNRDYSSVLKLANMEEPKASETIMNVDVSDEEEEIDYSAPKKSFFSRLNPFKRKEETEFDDNHEQDPFFKALHNSFQDGKEEEYGVIEPQFERGEPVFFEDRKEPEPGRVDSDESSDEIKTTFGSSQQALNDLRNSLKPTRPEPQISIPKDSYPTANKIISEMNQQTESLAEEKTKEDDEDVAYPFGGWTDEKNYRK